MYINNNLVFMDSAQVKVYPCGRRRSLINNGEASDKYYLPFDAEARLNTEANNRKHSGLNGYKQSYIYSFEEDVLIIVIGGYLFEIQLDTTLSNLAGLVAPNASDIYASIKLENITLFAGTSDNLVPSATTRVLRDQSFTSTGAPLTCLDLPYTNNSSDIKYYFSGLSFSAAEYIPIADNSAQQVISLRVLTKKVVDGNLVWEFPEESKLPLIDHGSSENSIKVGTIEADIVKAKEVFIGDSGDKAVTLNVLETNNNRYILHFIRN